MLYMQRKAHLWGVHGALYIFVFRKFNCNLQTVATIHLMTHQESDECHWKTIPYCLISGAKWFIYFF